MKKLKTLLAAFMLLMLFTFSQCKKHKDEPKLPPETTTGAMTFGCKVDGKIFVPKDGLGKPGLYVQYVNLGTGPGGGWFLNIPAVDYQAKPSRSISIVTDSLLLIEGLTYEFNTTKGNAKVFYDSGLEIFPKLNSDIGSLFIKKHDQALRILSGTFSFVGTNSNGTKVKITEGRFDIRY